MVETRDIEPHYEKKIWFMKIASGCHCVRLIKVKVISSRREYKFTQIMQVHLHENQ